MQKKKKKFVFLAFLAQLTLRAGGDDTNRETGASCGRAATPQLERDAGTCEMPQ